MWREKETAVEGSTFLIWPSYSYWTLGYTPSLYISILCYSYLGRKRMWREKETAVEGSTFLIWPSYSYWTLGYILSLYIAILCYSYLGRKRMWREKETAVEGSTFLMWPSYSYWTLGYILSLYIVILCYSYLGRKRMWREKETAVEGSTFLIWPSYSYWTLGYILSLYIAILCYSYLGRKRMWREKETAVEGSTFLIWPSYSYWTLGYILSLRGAKKLIQQEPLGKMIPVDEYLPIMFDQHPTWVWSGQSYSYMRINCINTSQVFEHAEIHSHNYNLLFKTFIAFQQEKCRLLILTTVLRSNSWRMLRHIINLFILPRTRMSKTDWIKRVTCRRLKRYSKKFVEKSKMGTMFPLLWDLLASRICSECIRNRNDIFFPR